MSDATQEPPVPDDNKYGKVKYASGTQVISNFIGSLKSRLDKQLSSVDGLDGEPSLTTSVPSELQTYLVDIFSTYSTSENVNLVNDSAVYLNKSASNSKVFQDMPWPVKKEAVVEGDVIIGGLMMVHEREDSITCGPIMPQGGIQTLEAMLYTLDQINFMSKPFLSNITLGAHILDDCDKDTYGLEMAVDFIKGR
ncbi:hypothetical protein NQ314_017503 [Rhamnusium bicolor]|uniref:Receptor ligand binding region domain-containing protein n=1 Tax=Rhamnusium bicolor TaxID=1586634 RepID=A0AAV8WUA4_9CUCU|nr:hypothetical protein NQ314_017503 [Rhamnusium bicolor]